MTPRQIQLRLASGEWERVHEAVYRIASAPVTADQALLGGCLATGGVASHRSAGVLHGLDVCAPGVPDVTTRTHRQLAGVTVHQTRRLAGTQIETVGVFPVTRPARTLLDLAAVLSPRDLGPALDSAVRAGLTTLDGVERCVDAHGARGFSGIATLRQLIDDRRAYGITRSRLENRVWNRFVDADIDTPLRNQVIYHHGERLGELDISWPWGFVGVECQSYQYHFDRDAWRRDQIKFNRFTAAGWRIFPATEAEAGHRFPELLSQVRHALSNCRP